MVDAAKQLTYSLVLGISLCAGAQAQETSGQMRSYVSGVGNDKNQCTVTSPCKTLQAAISRTRAGGEIYVLNSADYGPASINKAMTITSEGAVAGMLAPTGTALTIEAGPNDVINLRGLDLDGGNTGSVGINFKSGRAIHIQDSVVRGFVTTGIAFAPNGAANLHVTDTTLLNNKGIGLAITSSGQTPIKGSLHRLKASSNGVGIAISGSGANISIGDTIASYNTYGIGATASSVMVRNSTVIGNQVGIAAEQNSVVRMTQSTVNANTTGLQLATGGQIQSYGNNNVDGNNVDGVPSTTLALQ